MAKVTGTKKADTITVKLNEAVIGKGKKAKSTPISKSGNNYISGEAGNDTIYVKAGKSNYIYGDDKKGKKSGADKIIISGGNNNTIRGGKGVDTFTVNGGKKNILYGGAGNDVFVIGSNSTGSATVKDFAVGDKVKIIGNTSNIYASGKNMIIKGGKNGKAALTLLKAKNKTFTVTDSNSNHYSYSVSSGIVKATLKEKIVNGYNVASYSAAPFVTTIDARKVTTNYVPVTGNAKDNTIYVSNASSFGIYDGGKGNDVIIMEKGDAHSISGGEGNDTIRIDDGNRCSISGDAGNDIITINKGTNFKVYGGSGNDEIRFNGGGSNGSSSKIYGGEGQDKILIEGTTGDEQRIYGEEGNDTITVNAGTNHMIYGDDLDGRQSGDDTININKGSHYIYGGYGHDKIYINTGAGKQELYSGSGNDTITVNAGSGHNIYSGDGKDDIIVNLSGAIGSFGIRVSKNDTIDNLSINNAKFDELDFTYVSGQYHEDTLHITSKTGCEITIDHWTSYQPFSEGTIKFGGVEKTIAEINNKAGI